MIFFDSYIFFFFNFVECKNIRFWCGGWCMTLKIIEHIIEGQIILLLMLQQQLIFKIETPAASLILLTIIVIECNPDFRATAH